MVRDESLFTLLVRGLVWLLQELPRLLGNVCLLKVVSKAGHRNVLVSLAFEVLLQDHRDYLRNQQQHRSQLDPQVLESSLQTN